ncbi:MAG: hypothetical protein RRX92_05575 [Lachnospiraceae bacterium]
MRKVGRQMGLLDDVGESITEVAKEVGTKAKEIGGTAKIYVNIKAEEVKIQDLYYKLGKRYYSLYQDTADLELLDIIDAISACNDKIAKYKEEQE